MSNFSEIEITLLDLETKYRRAAKGSPAQPDVERYNKVKEAAAEAKQQVAELIVAIEKAHKE